MEPLHPGDAIERAPPARVVGAVIARAVVHSTNSNPSESKFPIALSNDEVLPPDTQIRRVGTRNSGSGLIDPLPPSAGKRRAGCWRPICEFEISALCPALPGVDTSSLCAGLLQRARATGAIIERGRDSVVSGLSDSPAPAGEGSKRDCDQRASSELASVNATNDETASSEQSPEKKTKRSHVQRKIGSPALNAIARVKSRRDNRCFEKSQTIGGTEHCFFVPVPSVKVNLPIEEVQKIMALSDAGPTFSLS